MPRRIQGRRQGRDPGRPTVLVATEGQTKKLYLDDLKRRWALPSLITRSDCGSDPRSVVRHLIHINGGPFGKPRSHWDEGWAVFDRDEHQTWFDAIDLARGNGINVVRSIPCIEIWFFAHFDASTGPWHPRRLQSELVRTHLAAYTKTDPCCEVLLPRLPKAVETATRWRDHHRDLDGDDNPSTEMDLLVTRLRRLHETGK